MGDFLLRVGGVYRISVDVVGGTSSIWSIGGRVPEPAVFTNTLQETTGSDFNWLMMPLDKSVITLASLFKVDIDANAYPSTIVYTIEQWNPTGQNYTTFTTVPFPIGDFSIYIGYPYRVTVDVSSGSSSTWP
jgi:hypothetical protein